MDDVQLESFAPETEPWRARALAFDRVFAAFVPFGAPFRPELGTRDLLFPTGPAALTEGQVAALAHATGDVRACVCLAAPGEGGGIFELPLTAEDYRAVAEDRSWCFIAHALFAVDGRWGVLTSGESHAVLAGPPEVVAAMRVALPDQTGASAARALREDWAAQARRHPDERPPVGDWVPAHRVHVLGGSA